jgi:hypothetical protein
MKPGARTGAAGRWSVVAGGLELKPELLPLVPLSGTVLATPPSKYRSEVPPPDCFDHCRAQQQELVQ